MAVLATGVLLTGPAPGSGAAAPPTPRPYSVLYDDFRNGFATGGPQAKWFHFAAGDYVGDDATVTTDQQGLHVRSAGTHPVTGAPAFTRTLGQEAENGGAPGGLDHVKWLVYANVTASSGFPGFDAVPGQELSCTTVMAARTHGTEGHPFGSAVQDPDDLRLAASAMNTVDFETMNVFDFFVTDDSVYAFYERLPFARTPGDHYAAYSYAIPVAATEPGRSHRFTIAYDRTAGRVRWVLDGREVFRVDRVGHRLERTHMIIDHGGVEREEELRQLACGMGQFTLLDASGPSGPALVRLSDAPGFYFDPARGEPFAEEFVDDESRAENRLFGQGASLDVRSLVVASQPAR